MQMDMLAGGVGLAVLVVVQGALLVRATRALTRVGSLETRLERIGDAVTLLTDTTESAFRAVAAEMSRRPAPAAAVTRAASAARSRRIASAARKGKSVAEIAAAEEVAESEVRLRLHVANDDRTRQPPRKTAKPPAVNGRQPRKAIASKGGKRAAVRVG
jgi:hypothetical protein